MGGELVERKACGGMEVRVRSQRAQIAFSVAYFSCFLTKNSGGANRKFAVGSIDGRKCPSVKKRLRVNSTSVRGVAQSG